MNVGQLTKKLTNWNTDIDVIIQAKIRIRGFDYVIELEPDSILMKLPRENKLILTTKELSDTVIED